VIPSRTPVPEPLRPAATDRVADFLKGAGFDQTLGSSFVPAALAAAAGFSPDTLVPVANPLSQEEGFLRPTLLVNLLRGVKRNLNFQRSSVALFEIGRNFEWDPSTFVVSERTRLALVACGPWREKTWSETESPADFYRIKGVATSLMENAGVSAALEPRAPRAWLHPKEAFDIVAGGVSVGAMGSLHPALANHFDVPAGCVVMEVDIETVAPRTARTGFTPLPKFPFVSRDVAVVVDRSVLWSQIDSAVKASAGNLLRAVTPFDVFSGGSLAPTQKSMAFRMTLRHDEHTLSDEEINRAVDSVRQSLQKHCGAQLR
jgi:phenylalanyl-tRNA synthetase beta chain